MARANLNIQTQINEEFLRAQDSGDVRLLKVKIQDEDLVLDGIVNKVGTPADDFNSVLLDSIADDQALFVLFRTSDDSQESSPWCMVAWVPDGCRVRDKMLYSSSREDLKRSLGLGFFKSEYAANQRSDLTWSQYQQSLDRNFDADVLTESERLVLEEKVIFTSSSLSCIHNFKTNSVLLLANYSNKCKQKALSQRALR